MFPAILEAVNGPEPWTEDKDLRRCELIDRDIDGTLTAQEAMELHCLQNEMLRYCQRVAPLPLEDTHKLHQKLLAKAATASAND